MPIIASDPEVDKPPRELIPEGQHLAVCCDVIDIGLVDVTWNNKTTQQHKILLRWQLQVKKSDGSRFLAGKRYTNSLHEKANLRKDLETWRGKRFTEEERRGFDVEKIIGVPCMLQVFHETKGDNTYANIISITPAPPGTSLQVEGYIRQKDYQAESGNGHDEPHPAAYDDEPPADAYDDLAF